MARKLTPDQAQIFSVTTENDANALDADAFTRMLAEKQDKPLEFTEEPAWRVWIPGSKSWPF